MASEELVREEGYLRTIPRTLAAYIMIVGLKDKSMARDLRLPWLPSELNQLFSIERGSFKLSSAVLGDTITTSFDREGSEQLKQC